VSITGATATASLQVSANGLLTRPTSFFRQLRCFHAHRTKYQPSNANFGRMSNRKRVQWNSTSGELTPPHESEMRNDGSGACSKRPGAKGQVRLCRADEHGILRCAYLSVRAWRSDGVHEEIERELRAGADVAVSRRSSLFLLLIRCSLPRLDIKRASKWAAALEYADRREIRSKRLPAFLHNNGGVEGAARARAKSKREMSVRDEGHARSPNTV
jgi:hypothetical protein